MHLDDDLADAPWDALTPWADFTGRVLSFDERLQHAAQVVARSNDAALDALIVDLGEQHPALPVGVRYAIIRHAVQHAATASAVFLQQLAADLSIEHAAGPLLPRSPDIH